MTQGTINTSNGLPSCMTVTSYNSGTTSAYICNGTVSSTTYSGYIDNATPTIERANVAARVMECNKAIERMERELRELRSRCNDEMEPGMPIEDFLGRNDAQGGGYW